MQLNRMKRTTLGALIAITGFTLFGAASCDSSQSGQSKDNNIRQSNYDKLVNSQPAHVMDYSPTRATKNFWIDTWNKPGKLSYVYLMDSNHAVFGYFILVGLPVSYCVSLVPPVQQANGGSRGDDAGGAGEVVIPAPSIDGTFGSSNNCNNFYGKDAVTGGYVEYTAGFGTNPLVFDSPQPQFGDARPMGQATISKVDKK